MPCASILMAWVWSQLSTRDLVDASLPHTHAERGSYARTKALQMHFHVLVYTTPLHIASVIIFVKSPNLENIRQRIELNFTILQISRWFKTIAVDKTSRKIWQRLHLVSTQRRKSTRNQRGWCTRSHWWIARSFADLKRSGESWIKF